MGIMGIIKNKIFALFFLILFANTNCLAFSNVDKTAAISVSLDYTDNVSLSQSNQESDLILRVNPSFGVSTQGSRLRTQLNYSVSGFTYKTTNNNNEIYHNLSSSATAEIVKNSIFLDGFANTRQVLLDQNLFASSDLVSGSQNATNSYTYGLSPTWRKKWDNYATSSLKYRYNEARFGGNSGQGDSSGEGIDFQLNSGTKFNRYFWDFNYNRDETSYSGDNSLDTSTETYYVTLGYHVSRQLDLRVRFGYENYDGTVNDGFGWTIGGNWHPNARTSVDASWGERAFGRTAFLDFTHRSKRITWQVNYSDDVTNSRNQLIANSQAINDINENPDDNQNSNINNSSIPLTTFDANLRLTRRLTGSAVYQYSKSTFSLRLYTQRLFFNDVDNEDNDNRGASLGWGWKLGGRTTMDTSLSWDRLEDIEIANVQNRKELSIAFNRNITPTVTGSLKYSFRINDADLKSSEYEENRISATLRKSF